MAVSLRGNLPGGPRWKYPGKDRGGTVLQLYEENQQSLAPSQGLLASKDSGPGRPYSSRGFSIVIIPCLTMGPCWSLLHHILPIPNLELTSPQPADIGLSKSERPGKLCGCMQPLSCRVVRVQALPLHSLAQRMLGPANALSRQGGSRSSGVRGCDLGRLVPVGCVSCARHSLCVAWCVAQQAC